MAKDGTKAIIFNDLRNEGGGAEIPFVAYSEAQTLNAAQKTQALNNLGVADWAKSATKPSYTWSEITNKPSVIAIKDDGVAEAGQYFDFHHTADTTSDYNVRLSCPNVSLRTVNLPSESGTLALTKDFLPLTGGTLTGSLTCEGLSVKYGDYGSRINLRYSSTNSGGYHCIYTQDDDSTIRFSATNSNGTSWTYQDYLKITRDGNIAAKGLINAKGYSGFDICVECDSNGYNASRNGEINRYTGDLHLQYNTNNNLTLCYGGGKVGIGMNATSHKLVVRGQIRSFDGGLGDMYYLADNSAGATYFGTAPSGDGYMEARNALYFTTASKERMRITSAGNVGIGTNNPLYKLHVMGSAVTDDNTVSNWTGYNIFYSGDHTYRAGIAFKGNVGATDYLKIETYYGNICLMPGIQGVGGNVGIGTTTPASKLHVMQSAWDNGITLQRTVANAGTAIRCLNSTGAELGNFGISGSKAFEVNFAGVNNNFYVDSGLNVFANAYYEWSDERLKNVKDEIDVNFDDIAKLPKIYYTLKDESDSNAKIGTIAQDVQKIYPELVKEDEKGYLSVQYDKLSIIALAAVDKLYKENQEMKKDIQLIKEKLGI